MTDYPFTTADLEALKAWDTPTICNGLEIVSPERRATGFTVEPMIVVDRKLPPTVGLARTGLIRAKERPRGPIPRREDWYEYVEAPVFRQLPSSRTWTTVPAWRFLGRGANDRTCRPRITAVAFILALSLRLPLKSRLAPEGRWKERADYPGVGLPGRTLGVIGLGGIGRELARLMRPYEMKILAADPYVDTVVPGLQKLAMGFGGERIAA
jgi:D-isomer specific 2-hydroxyacid dehydrogenase, NAD binding domain